VSIVLLLLVVVGGAYLRLRRLRTLPAWYPDEGSNVAVAAALAEGESAYLAFGHSSFINGHPVLGYVGTAFLFRLFGVDILWARLLAVSWGLLSVVLLYVVAWRMYGRRVALLAAAFYAVYPAAVVHNRLALTYNLLAPLFVLTPYCLWRALETGRRRWMAAAVLCAGVALLTDLAAASLAAFLVLALLLTRPRELVWALPLTLLPFAIWCGGMWLSAGAIFLQDLAFTLSRTGASWPEQIARVVFYRVALEGDLWLALGGVGLLLRGGRRRWLVAGLFGLSLLVFARNGPIFGQASYFLIPLFPLAAWGVGILFDQAVSALAPKLRSAWGSGLARLRLPPRRRERLAAWITGAILFLLLLAPPISMVAEGVWLDYGLYMTRFGNTLADPAAAVQVAAYVNARTSPDDVVLCSPTIAWLFDAQAADFQMAIAATGRATQHFPADIPVSRFRFDPRLENAAYVVLDPLWRGWGSAQMPEVAAMVEEVEAEWRLEKVVGSFEVYCHPRR
jgi:4-amino-4-deoxy-L-arabinose transferase-like glycosyltransferase